MKYRSEIDGLRALAVIPVVFFHAGFSAFEGGFVGVDVFFVISGYLITSLILSEKEGGTFSLMRFYERRARRILPALFLVTAVTLIFALWWALPFQLRDIALSVVAVSLFVSNFHFFFESGYFDVLSEEKPLLHTWSLAVEEQFYVLFPLFLVVFWFLGTRKLFVLVAVAACFSLALAQFGGNLQIQYPYIEDRAAFFAVPNWAFFLTPARAWELLFGVLVAFHLHAKPDTRANETLSVAGLGLILFAVFYFDASTPFPSLYALIPVVGTGLIILFARTDSHVGRFLSLPLFVGIGLISYSAYLWHQPLFAFARIGETDSPQMLSTLALCSFLFAWVSWRYVERPFRDPNLISRRKIFIGSGAATVMSIFVACLIYWNDGFPSRYRPDDRQLVTLDVNALAEYNDQLFNSLRLQDFPDGPERKVMVIGDSFAKDFVNILNESGMMKRIRVSTHTIEANCGNLLPSKNINEYIDPSVANICRHQVRYDSDRVQTLMQEADVILLASAWQEWEARLIGQSLDNISEFTNANLVVVGPKDFGHIRIRPLIGLSADEKRSLTNEANLSARQINQLLKAVVPTHQYIDVLSSACTESRHCPIFTPNEDLISWDGAHLTPEGAAWLGHRLSKMSVLRANLVP